MQCVVIQHVAFEDLGTFRTPLLQRGFDISYLQAGVDDLRQAQHRHADLLVVLGGPIGVNDDVDYPFIADELALIRERLKSGRPLLGICLGAQLIAAALGARVYPSGGKEIGWNSIDLTEAGRASCLLALDQQAPVLHWHGDTFELPAGATLLASTAATAHQAFSYGANVLALQFHPEADAVRMQTWLIGHACELAQAGISPGQILRDAQQHGALAGDRAAALLHAWLEQVGWRA